MRVPFCSVVIVKLLGLSLAHLEGATLLEKIKQLKQQE